jgi:2,3,4,5-tetrahydropyridine-2-carboxylate N-succinyltransferase
VPSHSVAVSATRPRRFGSHEYGLPCILIIKHLHEGERHDKGQLESILRDHGATV